MKRIYKAINLFVIALFFPVAQTFWIRTRIRY